MNYIAPVQIYAKRGALWNHLKVYSWICFSCTVLGKRTTYELLQVQNGMQRCVIRCESAFGVLGECVNNNRVFYTPLRRQKGSEIGIEVLNMYQMTPSNNFPASLFRFQIHYLYSALFKSVRFGLVCFTRVVNWGLNNEKSRPSTIKLPFTDITMTKMANCWELIKGQFIDSCCSVFHNVSNVKCSVNVEPLWTVVMETLFQMPNWLRLSLSSELIL